MGVPLHERERQSENGADGEHGIASGVHLLDAQELAEIPEQMSNAVDEMEGEREGESELQRGQADGSQLHCLECADKRVDAIGTGERGNTENRSIASESDSSSTVGNRKHAGQLRLVDREMRRLRAIEARIFGVE